MAIAKQTRPEIELVCLIFYLDMPEARLKLGSSLSGDHIKEGSDVYFDCKI